jgi:hypothetical protein
MSSSVEYSTARTCPQKRCRFREFGWTFVCLVSGVRTSYNEDDVSFSKTARGANYYVGGAFRTALNFRDFFTRRFAPAADYFSTQRRVFCCVKRTANYVQTTS